MAVAGALRTPLLLRSVRAAFVHRTDVALAASVGFALLGLVLSLAFMPGRARAQEPAPAGQGLPGCDRVEV